MSWSTSTPSPVAKTAITVPEATFNDDVKVEQADQFKAAVEAASLIAKAVGRDDDEVYVSLNGHANPGHGPRDGWADETVTVTVSVRTK